MEKTNVYLLIEKDDKTTSYDVVSEPVYKWLICEDEIPEFWLKMTFENEAGYDYRMQTGKEVIDENFIKYLVETPEEGEEGFYTRKNFVQINEFSREEECFEDVMSILTFVRKHNLNIVGEYEYRDY